MGAFSPAVVRATLITIVIMIGGLALADLAGGGGGVALLVIMFSCTVGGLLISRAITDE